MRLPYSVLRLEELEPRLLFKLPADAPPLGPPPNPGPSVFWVNTEAALQTAVNGLQSGQTIVIQRGTYHLSRTIWLGLHRPLTNVTIRGATDNFDDVVLLGAGMDNANYGNVAMGISVWNAQYVTIANLSVGNVYYHPIELKGDAGAGNVHLYHLHLFNGGEQIIKSQPGTGTGVNNVTLEYSLIEYTAGTPTTNHGPGIGYTDGISAHHIAGWDIRDNLFRNFHTPDSSSWWWNPVVLIWNGSSNNLVERNTFINADRAIAFGLQNRTGFYDNQGGIIRNNFVYMTPGLFSPIRKASADAQILVYDSPNTQVLNNTVITSGNTPRSIETRWTTFGVQIWNNLADARLGARDGGQYTQGGNYLTATASMFVNPASGNLHLVANSATSTYVIGKAPSLVNVTDDWDGQPRPSRSNIDIGADQYQAPSGHGSAAAPRAVRGSKPAAETDVGLQPLDVSVEPGSGFNAGTVSDPREPAFAALAHRAWPSWAPANALDHFFAGFEHSPRSKELGYEAALTQLS
jgi:hypothetical protein